MSEPKRGRGEETCWHRQPTTAGERESSGAEDKGRGKLGEICSRGDTPETGGGLAAGLALCCRKRPEKGEKIGSGIFAASGIEEKRGTVCASKKKEASICLCEQRGWTREVFGILNTLKVQLRCNLLNTWFKGRLCDFVNQMNAALRLDFVQEAAE
ncbi:hypothetical protein U1Q18_037923 [Sarracenia purpurea var. burkii]